MIGGTRKRPSSASGATASTSSRSRPSTTTSSRKHVGERVRLAHRLDLGQVELVDVGEVVEHVAQLTGERLDLGGGDVEPGEPGNLGDRVDRQRLIVNAESVVSGTRGKPRASPRHSTQVVALLRDRPTTARCRRSTSRGARPGRGVTASSVDLGRPGRRRRAGRREPPPSTGGFRLRRARSPCAGREQPDPAPSSSTVDVGDAAAGRCRRWSRSLAVDSPPQLRAARRTCRTTITCLGCGRAPVARCARSPVSSARSEVLPRRAVAGDVRAVLRTLAGVAGEQHRPG